MKIAICISGQPRTWKTTCSGYTKFIEQLKTHLLEKYPACVIDTFIHMWNFNTSSNTIAELKDTNKHPTTIYRENSIEIKPEEIKEILDFYNPVKYKIEDIDVSMKIIYDALLKPAPVGWAASQYYSIQQAAFLKREMEVEVGVEYDICFRIRFDLDFSADENMFPQLIKNNFINCHPNTLYSVHCSYDNSGMWPFYKIGDIFFYSDSLTFDLVCSFYDWLLLFPHELFVPEVKTELVFSYYINMLRITNTHLTIDPRIKREYI